MDQLSLFRVGERYSNDQIRFALAVENLGGIRPALDAQRNLRHVAILTAAEALSRLYADNPYHDRIEGDVLLYTAQGRSGDQELAGRNKRLIEQYTAPIPLYGFANEGRQSYRFLGLLELLRHYQETQADSRGAMRRVWLFEFRIHDEVTTVPIDHARELVAGILAERLRTAPDARLDREVQELPVEASGELNRIAGADVERMRGLLTQVNPYRFEHIVKSVMERSGFRDVQVTRASGDGGVDINAYVDDTNDFLAGTFVQAQVKRWRHAVGSVELNSFRGALDATAKGVFVTTSHFTRAAVLESRRDSKPRLTLIDGGRLAAIIIRREVDIETVA